MKRLFSVSLPRSGHHVVEMVLRGLMGSRFGYCEFYTPPDCCKQIPCSRLAAFAAQGADTFMQKSHDHELRDPFPGAVDGILVQVREPVARALSNYELDLAHVGPPHNPTYLRFWLGMEAAYTAAFFRKWCGSEDPRVAVLTYETLLGDPVGYFEQIFAKFAIPQKFFDADKVLSLQGISSRDRSNFKIRTLAASRYYDEQSFATYGALVAEAAALSGYAPTAAVPAGGEAAGEAGGKAGEIGLMCHAHAAALASDLPGALAGLDRYLDAAPSSPYGYHYRARLRRTLGMRDTALQDTRRALELDPGFISACVVLVNAELAAKRPDAALAAVQDCVAHAPDPATALARLRERLQGRAEFLAMMEARIAVAARPEPAPASAPELASGPGRNVLPADVVAMAFRFILGREPENDTVIEAHRKVGTVPALRRVLMGSPEFREKYRQQFLAG